MYGHSVATSQSAARGRPANRPGAGSPPPTSTSSGPGSIPNCSTSMRRARASVRNASACRPQRYCANARIAQRRSRNGSAATSASAAAATSRCSPAASWASANSSSTLRRNSSSRAASLHPGSQPSRSSNGRPRHNPNALTNAAAARSGSPVATSVRPRATSCSNRSTSTSSPETVNRYPPATVSIAAAPNTLRSRPTQICTCVGHDAGGRSPHTASAT